MRRALVSLAVFATACALPTGDTFVYDAASPELANASVDPTTGVWESNPWDGADWIPYPPQATVVLEHGLGRVPRDVWVYISFFPDGAESSLASGDLARYAARDETTLTIRNGTEVDLFMRVTAR